MAEKQLSVELPLLFWRSCSRGQCLRSRNILHDARFTSVIDLDRSNVLGGSIFVAYIVAALVVTSIILHSLHRSYGRIPQDKKYVRAFQIQLHTLCIISLVSFGVLTTNMLSFLVRSLQAFRGEKADIYGSEGGILCLLFDVLQWTRSSSLFADFAKELIATSASFWWSQYALVATLIATVYMSTFGMSIEAKLSSIAFTSYGVLITK